MMYGTNTQAVESAIRRCKKQFHAAERERDTAIAERIAAGKRITTLEKHRDMLLSALKGMLALDPTFTKSSMRLVRALAESTDGGAIAIAVYAARLAIDEVEGS